LAENSLKQAKVLSSEELKRVMAICSTMPNGKRHMSILQPGDGVSRTGPKGVRKPLRVLDIMLCIPEPQGLKMIRRRFPQQVGLWSIHGLAFRVVSLAKKLGDTTSAVTGTATASNGCLADLKTGGVFQHAMIDAPRSSSLQSH